MTEKKTKAQAAEPKAKKPPVDWDAVEAPYRANIRSLRDIGKEFGCTEGAIRKEAKKRGWERDLSAKINARAAALVRREEVRNEVRSEQAVSEKEIVEVNATMLAQVMREHRGLSLSLREVVTALISQVNQIVKDTELFEKVGELCFAPDEDGVDRLNELYRKVTAIPSQADVVKKLAETIRILIELERKMFKLDDVPTDPVEAAARGAAQGAAQGASESTKSMLAELLAETSGGS